MKNGLRSFVLVLLLATAGVVPLIGQNGSPASPAAGGAVRKVGSILKVSGSELSLATDQGPTVTVKLAPEARLYRMAPGAKDLKGATPIQLGELQVGDRALVAGETEADGTTLDASSVVVMKAQDIAQRKQRELADWQRRGVGGLVQQVDAQTGIITLLVGGKTVVVGAQLRRPPIDAMRRDW